MERDPAGLDQHVPGAKLDAGKNRLGLVVLGFARSRRSAQSAPTARPNTRTTGGSG